MTIVEVEYSKLEKLSDYVEKMLSYGGKVMSCIERMKEEEEEDYEHEKYKRKRVAKDKDEEEYSRYY